MNKKKVQAIVLAAGKSTRFNTGNTKLLEKICGQEMVLYAAKLLDAANIPTTFVVGYQKELIMQAIEKHHLSGIDYVTQEKQEGTGHAILCTKKTWAAENILICNGDCPLVTQDIINELVSKHEKTNAAISFVIAHNADPTLAGYGRLVHEDKQVKIVEAKEFTGDTNTHCCVNAGIYLVNKKFLTESIDQIQRNSTSNEFYFTDIVKLASETGKTITTVSAPFDLVRGINNLQELWVAEQVKRAELIRYWMTHGVQFSVAQNVHIDLGVSIGAGSRIGSGVQLRGATTIGPNCVVDDFSLVENSALEEGATVHSHCIVRNSHIGSHAKVGPFAHLRGDTHVGAGSSVGNFVEIKNTTIGPNTDTKHFTYLTNATVGKNVTLGAGTLTCNNDLKHTPETTVEDNAFVGAHTTIVAPLTIEKNAFVAAGSTLTQDVPANALAIGRARQMNKEDYAPKLREKIANEAEEHKSTKKRSGKKTDAFSFTGAITTNHIEPTQ